MTTDIVDQLKLCDPHDTDDVIKHLNAGASEIARLRTHAGELTLLLAKWVLYLELSGASAPVSADLRDHPILALVAESKALMERGP